MNEQRGKLQKAPLITRRRFLTVCAGLGVCATVPYMRMRADIGIHKWSGILFDRDVSVTLAHYSYKKAFKMFDLCTAEVQRLNNIFTPLDRRSALSRLNTTGKLENPPLEMVDLLKQARMYHEMTNGAFDITVKPLEDGRGVDSIGMEHLYISDNLIELKKPGMGITLGGISQGYITDRITGLVHKNGMRNMVVELGERKARGHDVSGGAWTLAIHGQSKAIPVIDKAVATSTAISRHTYRPHIFVPSTGRYVDYHKSVSVVANDAAMADALSTGFMALSRQDIEAIQGKYPSTFDVYFT